MMSAAAKALGAEASADRRCVIRWMMWTTIAIGRIRSHNLKEEVKGRQLSMVEIRKGACTTT